MDTSKQLLCVIRGGHRWETVDDSEGGVTICSRCGKLQHRRTGEGVADVEELMQKSTTGDVGHN
jgi:hypothetical protein